jgi:predicted nucleotidyltransferase
MDKDAAIEAVRFFGRRLTAGEVRVSKLILFGSHGRGEAGDESDVDVLVISQDFRGKDIFQRAEMICESERETIRRFHIPLDVILMTPEEFDSGESLIAEAARTGNVLVSATPEAVK